MVFEFVPPPPPPPGHGGRVPTGHSRPIYSPSRSLGTGTIQQHAGPASYPTLVHPFPAAPQAAHQAPIFRSIDEDIEPVPPPPMMLHQRNGSGGRSLTARQNAVTMPPIPESPGGLAPPLATTNSPTEDYIPIIHKRVPAKIRTHGLAPPDLTKEGARDNDDDGFTPITAAPPSASPKSPRRWFPTSPRDALGIPMSKYFLGRKLSKSGDAEDLQPLSPRDAPTSYPPVPGVPPREKKTNTIWGWWDLGLLERGKSLRRK